MRSFWMSMVLLTASACGSAPPNAQMNDFLGDWYTPSVTLSFQRLANEKDLVELKVANGANYSEVSGKCYLDGEMLHVYMDDEPNCSISLRLSETSDSLYIIQSSECPVVSGIQFTGTYSRTEIDAERFIFGDALIDEHLSNYYSPKELQVIREIFVLTDYDDSKPNIEIYTGQISGLGSVYEGIVIKEGENVFSAILMKDYIISSGKETTLSEFDDWIRKFELLKVQVR